MKIRDIIGKGRERRFRGPRKPRLKQVGFHKKMKNLLDAELKEEDKNTHLDHAEELVFMQGTEGIKRVVGTFTKLLNTLDGDGGGDAITTKWDGSPAVVFGFNPNNEFIFTDKAGFNAKNYDGKSTNADDLESMIMNRVKDESKRKSYAQYSMKMKQAFPTVLKSMPDKFEGYFVGDMLYFQQPKKTRKPFLYSSLML